MAGNFVNLPNFMVPLQNSYKFCVDLQQLVQT